MPLEGEGAAGALPSGAALARELLASPDTPRELLVAALEESQRRLAHMLSCVSGTFYRCELAPPWQMEFMSPGIEAITGHGPGFFAQVPYGELIAPEDMPALESAVAEAVARREHFTACYRIRHRDGSLRWVSERGAAVYDAAGEALFLEGYIADVTETKRLELEAEAARIDAEALNDKLSHMLESMLDCVISYDRDWNLTFANGRAIEEISRGGGSVWTGNFGDFLPIRSTPFWPLFREVMEHRRPRRIEGRMPAVDVWFDVYVVPDGDGVTAFFRNISDRKALEQEFVRQAHDLETTLDSIPVMVWTTKPDGSGDYYNRCWNEFIGRSPGAAAEKARPTGDWLHPDDRERAFAIWRHQLEAREPFEMEVRLRHHTGEYRWLFARVWPQRDEQGRIVKWYGAATDVHERTLAEHKLQETMRLQEGLLESSLDFIKVIDLQGQVRMVNRSAHRAESGVDPEWLIGQSWLDPWAPHDRKRARAAMRSAVAGKPVRLSVARDRAVGPRRWWDVLLSPICDDDGTVTNVLCVSRDVTELRSAAERLRTVSEQDFLTSLPNRRAFERYLKRATARARERGGSVGLMLLDLDHFKHVNDTLGHFAGDHLLRTVGRRLTACTAGIGFVARLGGDEFAVVLGDLASEADLVAAASRILARMERPVTYQGKLISGGLSIGCAIYPRDGADAHTLLRHADTALYDLKASGRGGIQMFNRAMKEAAERTATQLTLARRAIREDAVEPYYQPKVWLDTGRVAGFEALLRWWCPLGGIQMPGTVAEAFNDYDLSTRIGGLMQRRVLADMVKWLDAGVEVPPVSINASPAEFLRDDYAERLLQRIGECGVPPALIEIEITEHVFLERRAEQVVRALQLLKDAGVRVALDDFGTGHSSLAHLRDFPVDVLKIDQSFVSGMLTKPGMLAIVQAIAKLGPSLAIDIVAEGIETPEQLHVLRDAGCALGQGYLFGKAMDAREVTDRLKAAKWPFRARLVS